MSPSRYLYLGGLLVAAGLGAWAGWKLHPSRPASTVDSNTSVTVRETTRETRTDGSVVEKTKETSTASSKRVTPPPASPLPRWSVGARVESPVSKLQDYHWVFDLGRRVSDTNLWVTTGYSTKREVSVGLRIDF